VVVYPGAFRDAPQPADRAGVRGERGIPQDALVLCYSGTFTLGNGGLWLAEALANVPDLHVWGQVLGADTLAQGLFPYLRGADRLHLEPARLDWREAWSVTAAADIGLVAYLQDAPQYRHMGMASNRLCMFLTMGVPVIATRQPSFEFIEQYDCGVMVDGPHEMAGAVARIAARMDAMRHNARACAEQHFAAAQRWSVLREALASTVRP
jgi:glycosyltransferase involved in cell wall biosynthesis